jgi:DNA-binding IscR family transcriptional regulator
MRLNVQSDYALRLLMHLAANQGRLATIAEIAGRYGISKNHLMKVANALGREAVFAWHGHRQQSVLAMWYDGWRAILP